MKATLFAVFIFLLASFSQAKDEKKEFKVSGTIEIPDKPKVEGQVYLAIVPEGGELIKVMKKEELSKDAPILPDEKTPRFLDLGKANGKPVDFNIDLRKGKYTFGCIIKKGDPPCIEGKIDGKKAVVNCLPSKGDIVCPQEGVAVDEADVSGVHIQVGSPAGSKE